MRLSELSREVGSLREPEAEDAHSGAGLQVEFACPFVPQPCAEPAP